MSRPQRCGFVSLLYSIGDRPLSLWSKHVSLDGRIRRVEDQVLNRDKVIEIMGPHQTPVPTNITCPANPMDVLNIKLPIFVLVVKNLDLMFKLEFQLIDKARHRRQFSLTTHNHEKPRLAHANTTQIPLKLDEGWNNLEINLQTLCTHVHGSDYQAIQRIIVYPNCRLRRVYFQDRHYDQNDTPIELCQAFFDMYMLKWGIHLVERSCQTEEIYTGPLQPCDMEYFATESNMSIGVTTANLCSNEDPRINQIKKIMAEDIGVSMNTFNNRNLILKNNSKSVNQLDKKIARLCDYEFKVLNSKHSSSMTNNSDNISSVVEKRQTKSADSCKKDGKKTDRKGRKSKDQTQITDKSTCVTERKSLTLKGKQSAVRSFVHIEKSQFLKRQIGENFLNLSLETDSKKPQDKSDECNKEIESNQKLKNEKLIFIDSTGLVHSSPNVATVKGNSRTEIDMIVKKFNSDISSLKTLKNVETNRGNNLLSHSVKAIEEVITEVQRIREQLTNYDIERKINSGEVKSGSKDFSYNVPPVVEAQAVLSEEESKKAVLSTDKAVCNFLELRHAVNKKILTRLKDKGFTITEVELSIYNSKNRRNCYGQGKLIESGKGCADKGSGIASIGPVEMDFSLKKEQLSLNDKICMQLRNELDTALLQLKSTQVRVTTKMVQDTIGNIVKGDTDIPESDFFTVKEAQYIKKKVCNESMFKHDTETAPYIEHIKSSKNTIDDFIKNLEKYSGTEIVNVLFERQTYDSEAEFRSVLS